MIIIPVGFRSRQLWRWQAFAPISGLGIESDGGCLIMVMIIIMICIVINIIINIIIIITTTMIMMFVIIVIIHIITTTWSAPQARRRGWPARAGAQTPGTRKLAAIAVPYFNVRVTIRNDRFNVETKSAIIFASSLVSLRSRELLEEIVHLPRGTATGGILAGSPPCHCHTHRKLPCVLSQGRPPPIRRRIRRSHIARDFYYPYLYTTLIVN